MAIHDIVINTPSIAALIRDNKTFRIASDQQTGQKYGMISLDQNLFIKYNEGLISREDCLTKSADYQGMLMKLKEYDEAKALEMDGEMEEMAGELIMSDVIIHPLLTLVRDQGWADEATLEEIGLDFDVTRERVLHGDRQTSPGGDDSWGPDVAGPCRLAR